VSRAPRATPPGRRKVRFTLHRSRFFGAERQVRVEADLHAGGAEGGPDYSILSPDFCGGETLAALALALVDSRGNGCRPGERMSRAPRSTPPGRRKVRFTLHPLPFCRAEQWRTSTCSYRALRSSAEYGTKARLSSARGFSEKRVQARGVDESCASLHSPRPQKGSFHPASAAVSQNGTPGACRGGSSCGRGRRRT
jgi:hypothetical protein